MHEMTTATAVTTLSIVIPCYNEEKTLKNIVKTVFAIKNEWLTLDIIIVDDSSSDNSYEIAKQLEKDFQEVRVFRHTVNQGKGAALRTGFREARGDYVVIQDADLEYDPHELKKMLIPLLENKADVVLGSRYLSSTPRRTLYFWHSLMNRSLTFVSNMFTDLDITDMETCYKMFRRDLIKSIEIEENRFGFEPEIVCKIAQLRVKVYEISISYNPRTYAEGKKINWKDGIRALYCILHYGAPKSPMPLQALLYLFIGFIASIFNLILFMIGIKLDISILMSASIAYIAAAALNYYLCIKVLFRHRAQWNTGGELLAYIAVVAISGIIDVTVTKAFISMEVYPLIAKAIGTISALAANFLGRKYLVFHEPPAGPWKP